MEQITLFSGDEMLKINKKIRLIELFAGIGSQAKALKNIGADFEHYRICEFDKYAVTAYNAIHGTDFPVSDITKWHASDMGIEEKDKYEYIMTYSFPCTDISLAGKQVGMAKDSGTRSGLLWEVERLLEECDGNLPQILLMENVDAILFEKNRKHFFQWCNRLEEFGYKNYYQVLNAKDYGIPQNRNRCFMVSILGDYYFEFPKPIKLELCVKDMLEKEVPEKYYISAETVKKLLSKEFDGKIGTLPNDCDNPIVTSALGSRDYKGPKVVSVPIDNLCIPCLTPDRLEKRQNGRRFKEDGEPMFTLTAQDIHGVVIGGMQKNQTIKKDGICTSLTASMGTGGGYVPMVIENPDIKQLGNISNSESYGGNPQTGRVYDPDYICPAINTMGGGQREPKFLVADGIAIRTNNEKGYDIAQDGDTINLEQPNSKTRRGRVGKQIAQTIMTSTEQAVVEKEIIIYDDYNQQIKADQIAINTLTSQCGSSALRNSVKLIECQKEDLVCYNQFKPEYKYRIRKLMPIECYKLQGFTREDFFKVKEAGISDSQCYKQAGNSITVPVLEAIFRNMNIKGVKRWQE